MEDTRIAQKVYLLDVRSSRWEKKCIKMADRSVMLVMWVEFSTFWILQNSEGESCWCSWYQSHEDQNIICSQLFQCQWQHGTLRSTTVDSFRGRTVTVHYSSNRTTRKETGLDGVYCIMLPLGTMYPGLQATRTISMYWRSNPRMLTEHFWHDICIMGAEWNLWQFNKILIYCNTFSVLYKHQLQNLI